MHGLSSTDLRDARHRSKVASPFRWRTAIACAAGATFLALSGCSLDPPEVREAKSAARTFASALRLHDADRLQSLSSCVVATEGIADARFRYLEPPLKTSVAALDSLALLYSEGHRMADSSYAAAPDSTADLEARFERARNLARRAATTRAARRAADRSSAGLTVPSDATLRSVRAHVLVRFAGEAIGPAPIERDTVVRLLRAPGGSWIVYAFDLASDAPAPLPY